MQKKLQVFVSSTYTDMKEERQSVVDAILRAGHIPAGMELFAAGDESQLETIRRWINDSDVFMLILGGRYGSIEPKSGKSYIELEYEYAIEKKIPVFAAVISEAFLDTKVRGLGPDAIERVNGALLEAFKTNVKTRICRFFDDVKELKIIVFESLGNFAKYPDLSGWVRGSEVIDPRATLQEMSRLQAANEQLRLEIASLEASARNYALLNQPEGPVASSISEEAKALLVAAKNFDGRIMYVRHSEGAEIQAANQNFIDPYSHREEARWSAAIDELRSRNLIEDVGYQGEIFQMTKLGYEVADELEA